MKTRSYNSLEIGAYGTVEVAHWLRIPYRTLRNWIDESGLIVPADRHLLSFYNVLELHVLKGMRKQHSIPMQRIRLALKHVRKKYPSAHPLIDLEFQTDGFDIFIDHLGELINASCQGQTSFREIVSLYLRRISRDAKGNAAVLYPFVTTETEEEPSFIAMSPQVAFGKPVITGTGISTAIVAARFRARESVSDLANEYGLPEAQIEEAVRWEAAA